MVEKRNVYTILVGKFNGEGPLERPMYIKEDNIKTDLGEI
jgi:hypothetical protein